MASSLFSNISRFQSGFLKLSSLNKFLLHQPQVFHLDVSRTLLAFICLSLLMSVDVLPGRAAALRRIQNDAFQSWDSIPRDYDYADLEDQDVLPVVPHAHRQQPQHHHGRPPDNPRNYPSGPGAVSFGGQFHISRDRFVPFVASDVVLDQLVTANPQPVVHPKPKAIPFVPDAVPAFQPQTTSEPSYVYYTPSTLYYITTRPPFIRPNPPETIIENKREQFYTRNETETFVLTGQRPNKAISRHSATVNPSLPEDSDRIDGSGWRRPPGSFNKLTATENQPPLTDSPHDFTTSQYIDLQRTIRPNTIYPYPADRGRSSSEYRPSDPVNSLRSRNDLVSESTTTDRPIVTASTAVPVSETPFDEQHKRRLSSGAIAGIAIGILAPLALVAGAVVYLFCGRHFKTANHKGVNENYIDDSVRPSGFMNSHIELPKESSEEMTSLDNDSFLNSLEAVTIQNYWAESAKNTKV